MRQQRGIALVVDDDEGTCVLVAAMLRLLGFTPEIAGDGQEALESVQRRRPSFVVVDIEMPRMGGLSFLDALARRVPEGSVTAIGMSGHHPKDGLVARQLVERGVEVFLQKPVTLDILRGAIELAESSRQVPRSAQGRPWSSQAGQPGPGPIAATPDQPSVRGTAWTGVEEQPVEIRSVTGVGMHGWLFGQACELGKQVRVSLGRDPTPEEPSPRSLLMLCSVAGIAARQGGASIDLSVNACAPADALQRLCEALGTTLSVSQFV